ncbi:pancreatic triacylglycerol lipase [Aplysia californica]|uniref:Pancreatic triacylglycerol lipase n=1 Tax=Aplysia californica TaxID=6500 RepID=A0ABM1VTS8_APLCA|nr:pancreatic triacylglycerol lipase [Aplysia californica]
MSRSSVVSVCFFLAIGIHLSYGWLFSDWLSRCYDSPPVGCFPTSHPYNNSGSLGPQSPSRQQIRFHLRQRGQRRQSFGYNNARTVLQRKYNPSHKTVVIVHGYLESARSAWVVDMAHAILNREEANVIVVDWRKGARSLVYPLSVANTRVVGAVLALVLQELVSLGGDLSTFHIIGFSLGAHVAGYAGERLPGLGRITGLDPAAPGFRRTPPPVRLDPSDATLVDVYHTDCSPVMGAGLEEPLGTVDFYLNRGMEQPGCGSTLLGRFAAAIQQSRDFSAFSREFACSHSRAYLFYISTISNNVCEFPVQTCSTVASVLSRGCQACQCPNCPTPGYGYEASGDRTLASRLFNVETTSSAPYCAD